MVNLASLCIYARKLKLQFLLRPALEGSTRLGRNAPITLEIERAQPIRITVTRYNNEGPPPPETVESTTNQKTGLKIPIYTSNH